MKSEALAPAAFLLPYNPVWRSYAGGKALRTFRGKGGTGDDHFPEDWLASTVRARNGANAQNATEGLSVIHNSGSSLNLTEAFQCSPEFWFGQASPGRTNTRVLWKLLDASVRLQFQAHPNADFARKRLNSNAGKTECWYILSTRGEACVYLGFQRPPARADWAGMIRNQQIERMLECFEPIPVRSGDCFVVPAGTPHAIGAGVFMVELMEPTDWVVRCETTNAGVTLPPEACFMGLTIDECLEIFDYRNYSLSSIRKNFQQTPRKLRGNENFVEEEIISAEWHQFFRLHRLIGYGKADWIGDELMLVIVVRGNGHLSAGSEIREISTGQTWLLPGAVENWSWEPSGSGWELIIAKLPILNKVETSGPTVN